jgi:membrane fusion protein (multidrug efflux system)
MNHSERTPALRRHALAAALAALLLAGPVAAQPFPGMPPPEVAVITVQPKTLPVNFDFTGQVAGYREVEVRARVAGILKERNFTEGESVTKGKSLYTIDRAPFESALARAEADVAGAEARHAQARRNAARLKPLIEAKAISQKDFDDAASAEQIAEADLRVARARLTDARLNLDYTKVEAPISGVTGRSQRPEGTLVSGPDVLLTTVTQIDPAYVYFGVSENDNLKWQSESAAGRLILPRAGRFDVTVKLADGSTYAHRGRLGFSDVRINANTGTSDTRAELPNTEGKLRPGQFVRVTLSGATRPNAIAVPQRAVLEGPKGKFVWVVNAESKVEFRPVMVGDWAGDQWVINSGLAAGDRVIVDGVMKVGPGAPVKPVDANAPKPAAGAPGAPGAAPKDGAAKDGAAKSAAAPAAAAKK